MNVYSAINRVMCRGMPACYPQRAIRKIMIISASLQKKLTTQSDRDYDTYTSLRNCVSDAL